MAEVSLNGKPLGIVWKTPFRLDITAAAKPGKNQLEIRVCNTWHNRLVGDAKLPAGERKTKTNITKYEKGDHPLMPSGLFGPVVVRTVEVQPLKFPE